MTLAAKKMGFHSRKWEHFLQRDVILHVHTNKEYIALNTLKTICSCRYTSILDSSAFNCYDMFMKLNGLLHDQTNLKRKSLQAICGKMLNRCWERCLILFSTLDFHSTTTSSLISNTIRDTWHSRGELVQACEKWTTWIRWPLTNPPAENPVTQKSSLETPQRIQRSSHFSN